MRGRVSAYPINPCGTGFQPVKPVIQLVKRTGYKPVPHFLGLGSERVWNVARVQSHGLEWTLSRLLGDRMSVLSVAVQTNELDDEGVRADRTQRKPSKCSRVV